MRKLLMSIFVLGGLMFAGTVPASANAASGLTAAKIAVAPGQVEKARWRHHRRGAYFGWGYPSYRYGYYPRHRYWRHHHRRGWYWRHHHRRWGHHRRW